MAAAEVTSATDTIFFRLRTALDVRIAATSVLRMASLAHCTPVDVSLLATIVSELSSNIIKYAGTGQVRVQTTREEFRTVVEVVAEDQGPGIDDIALALQEHYSSSGTLGLGLSGVRRMVSEFNIDSAPGKGCRVQVRKWMATRLPATTAQGQPAAMPTQARPATARGVSAAALSFDVAELNRPCYPELVSGDSTVVQPLPHGMLLACIDGSGHGARAHALSQRLAQHVRAAGTQDLVVLLRQLHQQAVGTLGAAVSLAFADPTRTELTCVGIGNVRVRCVGAAPWTAISRDGVLGERFPTPELQRFPLHAGDVVLMTSDGIHERLSSQVLARAHLGTALQIAQSVLQHGGKTSDDASCVVLKCMS